jgi:hypothetical protein
MAVRTQAGALTTLWLGFTPNTGATFMEQDAGSAVLPKWWCTLKKITEVRQLPWISMAQVWDVMSMEEEVRPEPLAFTNFWRTSANTSCSLSGCWHRPGSDHNATNRLPTQFTMLSSLIATPPTAIWLLPQVAAHACSTMLTPRAQIRSWVGWMGFQTRSAPVTLHIDN